MRDHISHRVALIIRSQRSSDGISLRVCDSICFWIPKLVSNISDSVDHIRILAQTVGIEATLAVSAKFAALHGGGWHVAVAAQHRSTLARALVIAEHEQLV